MIGEEHDEEYKQFVKDTLERSFEIYKTIGKPTLLECFANAAIYLKMLTLFEDDIMSQEDLINAAIDFSKRIKHHKETLQ